MPSGGTSRTSGRRRSCGSGRSDSSRAQRRAPPAARHAARWRSDRRLPAAAPAGAGAERIARFAVVVLDAEQDLRDRPSARGQDQVLAGLCGEVVGLRKLPRLPGSVPGDPGPCRLGGESNRNGAASGAVSKGDCMLISRNGRAGWCSKGITRPINRPLGLTVYCLRVRLHSLSHFRELKCHASTVQPCRISCRT